MGGALTPFFKFFILSHFSNIHERTEMYNKKVFIIYYITCLDQTELSAFMLSVELY